MAKAPNGQIYFMNHITKTTQWEDPRKVSSRRVLIRDSFMRFSNDLSLGWEMPKAPNGQIYFMNHITKTTQWEDPRKVS
jgi:hypothetical protein